MKKLIIAFVLACISAISVSAQETNKLHFSKNGDFKIVQFTDTHINTSEKSNLISFDIIKEIVELENPDLVIFTGDIMTQKDPRDAYDRLNDLMTGLKTPFAVVFGNHESERDFTRKQLADYIQHLSMCLNQDKGEVTGNSNFVIPIRNSTENINALLYCLDSNSYSSLKPKVSGYGWFDFSQIDWYRNKSREYSTNNNKTPLPALAFFHIPLQEYANAWNNKESNSFGSRNEDESTAELNPGMFTAMVEGGDVMGTFVGHDHLNDYISDFLGIALAYGRVSKIMKDKEDPLAGARVILLIDGKRQFTTWIRETGGKKVYECVWPDSFRKQSKKTP